MSEWRRRTQFPDYLTIREAYEPGMTITDPAAAADYFEALVEHHMRISGHTREQAIAIERQNLGYYAGYYDAETAARVYRLFQAAHPIFGRARPTPEEAMTAGRRWADRDESQSGPDTPGGGRDGRG